MSIKYANILYASRKPAGKILVLITLSECFMTGALGRNNTRKQSRSRNWLQPTHMQSVLQQICQFKRSKPFLRCDTENVRFDVSTMYVAVVSLYNLILFCL